MELVREHLLQALSIARPAVASHAYVPTLTHFCFDEVTVTAYNDISAISVRLDTDLRLCLPAEMLIKVLNSMSTERVLVQTSEEGIAVISSGKSKVKVAYLSADDFPFDFPLKAEAVFPLSQSILMGIEKCLMGVGSDPTHPAQMGVTLEPDSKGCRVYSTDNYTISRYQTSTPLSLPADAPIILPTFFCNQLLALAKAFPSEPIQVSLFPGAVVAKVGAEAQLFTKLLADLEPLDFASILDRYLKGQKVEEVVSDIPPGFDAAFDRALLVLSSQMDKATKVEATEGALKLLSTASTSEARDSLTFKGEDSAAFFVDPSLVARASKYCSGVGFLPRAMVMAAAGFTHLIAHCSS